MTDDKVTVIGLGSMGTAIAEAFIRAGHPTTVWNRTSHKAALLAARGAIHAEAIEDAVAASPLVITCLTTYEDTRQILQPVAAALSGRTLATLNSGSPAGARETAAWADSHAARYLDGAVKNVPAAVGAPDTLIYYSGNKAVFDAWEPTLTTLGGDTVATRSTWPPCTRWRWAPSCCPPSSASSRAPPPSGRVGCTRAAWCASPASGWT
ncbi:NAD(P)-dependent oxidoreductase [Actinomadura sp. ATCC 39365]